MSRAFAQTLSSKSQRVDDDRVSLIVGLGWRCTFESANLFRAKEEVPPSRVVTVGRVDVRHPGSRWTPLVWSMRIAYMIGDIFLCDPGGARH